MENKIIFMNTSFQKIKYKANIHLSNNSKMAYQ